MTVSAGVVRYIKLGRGGRWESAALERGERRDRSDSEAVKLGFMSPKISDGRPRMASATICHGDCTEKSWMRYDCYGKYDNWSDGLKMSVRPTSVAGLIAAIACGTIEPSAVARPD